jgi:hypothetical protein
MSHPDKSQTHEQKKDIILLLEDKEEVIKAFEYWLQDSDFDIEFIVARNYDDYDKYIGDPEMKQRIKCMIMDLSNNQEEESSGTYKSVAYINKQYAANRIPIFIHSGFLDSFTELVDKGTVFRIAKTTDSVNKIFTSIKLMSDSGFLNIFSFGGTLEKKIMIEMHSAFVDQFKANEIEEIISSIQSASTENLAKRTQEVFERLALRAVFQNAVSNKPNEEGIKVNSIEHYYRRNIMRYPFWTGDIFQSKNSEKELLFLATPRCNISNTNFEQLMFFKINKIKDEQTSSMLNKKLDSGETKGVKQIRKGITDDVTNAYIGERFRFLPKTPQFEGGFVDCMKCLTFSNEILTQEYDYVISLVDDLTNDVVRKAAAYMLRGGISDTAYEEAMYYFEETENQA